MWEKKVTFLMVLRSGEELEREIDARVALKLRVCKDITKTVQGTNLRVQDKTKDGLPGIWEAG